MERSYMHNSLMFIGSAARILESSASEQYKSALKSAYYSSDQQDAPSQYIGAETLSFFYDNDEYMGSTSPYDDDGC